MEWFISIPSHEQLMLIATEKETIVWLLFERIFPSYVRLDLEQELVYTDVAIYRCGIDNITLDSDVMYKMEEGHRYGVYMLKNNRIEYLDTWKWNEVPPIDYKGKMPFMLTKKCSV